jgi:cell division protein FtsQ
MSKTGSKILGTFFFLILISLVFYLILLPKKIARKNINKIEISGNKYLSETDYLKQTKLLDVSEYKDLTLSVIKDRLEKHPYILRADVELKNKEVLAYIIEKRMMAVLLKGTNPYFVSSSFEILPLMPGTKFMDLPVISNPENGNELKSYSLVNDDDLFDAFKIIETAKLLDNRLLDHISEINLRDGGDIVLTISGYPIPVIFGRGGEARKMVYLESLWNNQTLNEMIKNTNYLDLRFADNIYIGPETAGQNIGPIE